MDNQTERIKQLAGMTRLTPHLIRIWKSRSGLLFSQRAVNGYRLSSEEDLPLRPYLKSQITRDTLSDCARLGLNELKDKMAPGSNSIPEVSSGLFPVSMGILGIGEAGATFARRRVRRIE